MNKQLWRTLAVGLTAMLMACGGSGGGVPSAFDTIFDYIDDYRKAYREGGKEKAEAFYEDFWKAHRLGSLTFPIEIEEASMIDGCNPLQTFFLIVFPILKPTMISVGILEAMWVWNDYLLPYLVLDRTKYMTIPIHIQYLKGSYGTVDLGATMALILMSIIPVQLLTLQKKQVSLKPRSPLRSTDPKRYRHAPVT